VGFLKITRKILFYEDFCFIYLKSRNGRKEKFLFYYLNAIENFGEKL